MSGRIQRLSREDFSSEEWSHLPKNADWKWNTDNQDSAAIENLPLNDQGERTVFRTTGKEELITTTIHADGTVKESFRITADELPPEQNELPEEEIAPEDEKGIDSPLQADPEENPETADEREMPAPMLAGQIPGAYVSDELLGYFEPADSPMQFEPGTTIIMEGIPGEVVQTYPIEGEVHVKAKLATGISAFYHWKDLYVYVPTIEELQMQMLTEMGVQNPEQLGEMQEQAREKGTSTGPIESSLTIVSRRWDDLKAPHENFGIKKAWQQTKAINIDDNVIYKGHKVRVIGKLDDGLLHIQNGSFDEIVNARELGQR